MPLSFILPNLLTWDGERPVIGGLERMAWALIDVATKTGYAVDVHQNGSSDWVRTVNGVTIQGHGLARMSLLAAMESIHHQTTQCVYLSIMQEPVSYRPQSLVVSHGVWWDIKGANVQSQFEACRMALQQAREVISVDYNFLNVIRAVFPELAEKLRVIPNFVDTDQFSPPATARLDPPTILFPRRIDPARGINLFLEAIGPLLADNDTVRVIMSVDQNNESYNTRFSAQLNTLPFARRIEVVSTPFDQMPQRYREADIVVIPSTYSEGTSLACLEAMASGCAVVATDVGGLTNLILPEFNGLLVPPRKEALHGALSKLLEDRDWRRQLGHQARMSALAFGRARWEVAWAEVLLRVYGPPAGRGKE